MNTLPIRRPRASPFYISYVRRRGISRMTPILRFRTYGRLDQGYDQTQNPPNHQIKPNIRSLQLHYSTNHDCSICLEKCQKDDKLKILPCGHLFHEKCCEMLIQRRHHKCPLCRTELTSICKSPEFLKDLESTNELALQHKIHRECYVRKFVLLVHVKDTWKQIMQCVKLHGCFSNETVEALLSLAHSLGFKIQLGDGHLQLKN